METMGVQVNAVAFQEGDLWVVQGIEYDICTRARDVADIPLAFARALAANACIALDLGREPSDSLPKAPSEFQEMFDGAATEMRAVHSFPVPGVTHDPAVNVRLHRKSA